MATRAVNIVTIYVKTTALSLLYTVSPLLLSRSVLIFALYLAALISSSSGYLSMMLSSTLSI